MRETIQKKGNIRNNIYVANVVQNQKSLEGILYNMGSKTSKLWANGRGIFSIELGSPQDTPQDY